MYCCVISPETAVGGGCFGAQLWPAADSGAVRHQWGPADFDLPENDDAIFDNQHPSWKRVDRVERSIGREEGHRERTEGTTRMPSASGRHSALTLRIPEKPRNLTVLPPVGTVGERSRSGGPLIQRETTG